MDRFRFQNAELQDRLQRLHAAAGIPHEIAGDGTLLSDEAFEASAEALRSVVRSQRFPAWHTHCVFDGAEDGDVDYQKAVYRHLAERAIPFEKEEHNGECWILLSEDEVLPDSLWESTYGAVSTYTRTNPSCCFCQQVVEGEVFGEISIRRPDGAFRSVLYSHLDCLRIKIHPESLHIMDTVD